MWKDSVIKTEAAQIGIVPLQNLQKETRQEHVMEGIRNYVNKKIVGPFSSSGLV